MNAPPEHRDHLVEALATTKGGPGCGCIGWAVFAVVFLIFGGGAIGVWRPLIVLPVVFIVVGAVLWTLFAALRNGRVRRGRYDPRNADRHPAALGQDAGGEPADGRAPGVPTPAGGPVVGAAEPAGTGAGVPADPAPPPAVPPTGAPAPAPFNAPVVATDGAGVTPADFPGAPQAPSAPEAPSSPWA